MIPNGYSTSPQWDVYTGIRVYTSIAQKKWLKQPSKGKDADIDGMGYTWYSGYCTSNQFILQPAMLQGGAPQL